MQAKNLPIFSVFSLATNSEFLLLGPFRHAEIFKILKTVTVIAPRADRILGLGLVYNIIPITIGCINFTGLALFLSYNLESRLVLLRGIGDNNSSRFRENVERDNTVSKRNSDLLKASFKRSKKFIKLEANSANCSRFGLNKLGDNLLEWMVFIGRAEEF